MDEIKVAATAYVILLIYFSVEHRKHYATNCNSQYNQMTIRLFVVAKLDKKEPTLFQCNILIKKII